jgi:Holliday junction resolvase RusA-like endonuclease
MTKDLTMLELTIPGKPIAKKRPRFFRRGNFVGTYNDQQTEEGRWQLMAQSQIKETVPTGTPIALVCMFYMPIPKSTPKKNRTTDHTKKPDLDNLVKYVKDCLNGVLWHDDSQVSHLTATKRYSENPRTEIIVQW